MPKYTFSFVWRGMEDGGEGSSVLWPMANVWTAFRSKSCPLPNGSWVL